MRKLALGTALLMVCACNSQQSSDVTQQAVLRTAPLVTCTADQQKACPGVQPQTCPAGQQPVIDYSSDCCAHLTCQPICSSSASCPTTPAPACPPGTHLWIGTAVEDCCPAFRCDPDTAQCDPTKPIACTLAVPVCPGNVPPMVVGQSSECCPIYQCACDGGTSTSTPVSTDGCGCTKPVCKPGEATVCAGTDPCGGPCTCQQQQSNCTTDADCPSGESCNTVCVGWGCATASSPVVAGSAGAGACSCPAGDATCQCDSSGSCTGQTCLSQCVPAPICDPTKPVACPMSILACSGGQQPVIVGTDATTCCPIQKCPICPTTAKAIACPMMPSCACTKQVGIDPNSCCPSYTCGSVDPATGNCL